MAHRRVNIQILDDIDPADAVAHVLTVMRGGRVSHHGTHYCWATTFNDGTVVYVRGPNKRAVNSFIVYKEKTNEETKAGSEVGDATSAE